MKRDSLSSELNKSTESMSLNTRSSWLWHAKVNLQSLWFLLLGTGSYRSIAIASGLVSKWPCDMALCAARPIERVDVGQQSISPLSLAINSKRGSAMTWQLFIRSWPMASLSGIKHSSLLRSSWSAVRSMLLRALCMVNLPLLRPLFCRIIRLSYDRDPRSAYFHQFRHPILHRLSRHTLTENSGRFRPGAETGAGWPSRRPL